jgi:hypothetical protein
VNWYMAATGPVFRFHLSESVTEEGNGNLCEVLHASVFINAMINKRSLTWSLR